jgi:hypothetical protein
MANNDLKFVIVRRGQFATFELLTHTFADDHGVQIIWDRRIGERRQAPRGPEDGERRRRDRRREPPSQWNLLNYMIGGENIGSR